MFKKVVIRNIEIEDFKLLTYLIEALGYSSSTNEAVERLMKINEERTYKTLVV